MAQPRTISTVAYMDLADERRAAKQAEVAVTSLEHTIPRSDAKVVAVRYAAAMARDAITKCSSEAALDAARGTATKTLYELCVLMDRHIVTRDAIVRAQRAVATWLNALGVQRG